MGSPTPTTPDRASFNAAAILANLAAGIAASFQRRPVARRERQPQLDLELLMENPEDVVPQLLKAWAQSDPTLQRLKAKLPERWADLFGEGPGDKPEPAAAGARRP